MRITIAILTASLALVAATPMNATPDTEVNDVHKLERVLESFVGEMRTFVNETHFDNRSFHVHYRKMDNRLSNISSIIWSMYSVEKLLDQLIFVRDKFRMMRVVKELMTSTYEKSPGDKLIFALNDMEVKLLVVQNSRGDPDPRVPKYNQIVPRFFKRLADLQKERSELAPVPTSTDRILDNTFDRLRGCLEDMELHLKDRIQ